MKSKLVFAGGVMHPANVCYALNSLEKNPDYFKPEAATKHGVPIFSISPSSTYGPSQG